MDRRGHISGSTRAPSELQMPCATCFDGIDSVARRTITVKDFLPVDKSHRFNNNNIHFLNSQSDTNFRMSGQRDTMSWEEEKKESSPEQRPFCSGGLTHLTRPKVCDSEIAARAGIPEEIKNHQYASERELLIDLEKLGV